MLSRNVDYGNKVTTDHASINKSLRLILSCKGEQVQKTIKSVSNTPKDYDQKIMQHNTFVKVENWALHLKMTLHTSLNVLRTHVQKNT